MTAVVTVTVTLQTVPARNVARLVNDGRRTVARQRREPGVLLAKLLGTSGPRFTPADTRLRRWALLTSDVDGSAARHQWRPDAAAEHATLVLRPLASRGRWSGVDPFPMAAGEPDHGADDQPVVTLTRATVRARRAWTFYRAVPPITSEVARAEGLRLAFGFGETPLLRQGTFSLWQSRAALAAFLRASPAHADAVRRTAAIGWYAEELFARFAVVSATGVVDGRPLEVAA